MSALVKDKKSLFIIFKWVFGIALLISVLITLWAHLYLDKFIKNRIIEGVYKSSDGLYQLEIKALDAKLWNGAIAMSDITLKPDPHDLKLKNVRDSSGSIQDITFYIDSASISSIKWFRYILNNKKLDIGVVLVENPNFIIKGKFQDNPGIKSSQRNFLDLLPGIVAAFTGALKIERIQVENGKLCYDLYGKSGLVKQTSEKIMVDLKKIAIDTVSERKALYSDEAFIDMYDYSITTPDKLHIFKVQHIAGIIHDSVITFSDLYYYQKDSAVSKYKDEFNISMKQIQGKGIDFGNLFRDQKIFIRTMLLDHPDVKMYTSIDPVKKFSQKKDKKTEESILDELTPYLSGAFRIDTLSIDNGKIHYEIKNDELFVMQGANNIYLDFSRVLLDSNSTKSKVYAEDAVIKLKNFKIYKQNVSKLDVGSLYISWADSLLNLSNISFVSSGEDSMNIHASEIAGEGVDYMEMLKTKKATMKSFVISDPLVYMKSAIKAKEKNKKHVSPSVFFKETLGPLADASFKADKFAIKNGNINYSNKSDTSAFKHELKNVQVAIHKLRVDSAAVQNHNYFDDFNVKFSKYKLNANKSNINLAMDDVWIDSKKKYMHMKDICLSQIDTSGEYVRYYFNDSIEKVTFSGFDFDRLVKKQQLHINYIKVDEMKLNLCFDDNKSKKTDFDPKMPNELVRGFKFYVRLDSLDIIDSYVYYSEKRKGLKDDGFVLFESLHGSMYNFTNDKKYMTNSMPFLLKGRGKIMGHSFVQLNIEMPLLSEKFNLKYNGQLLEDIPMSKFNNLLRYSGMEIEEGIAQPSEFDITFVEGLADGNLTFMYKNLKVTMLDKEREKSKKLLSLGGSFVIKNSNPTKEGESPETVTVSAVQNEEDAFFNLLWRVIRSGISETITKSTFYKVDNGDK